MEKNMYLCENKFMEKRAIIIAATSGIGKQLAINLLQDAWVVGEPYSYLPLGRSHHV